MIGFTKNEIQRLLLNAVVAELWAEFTASAEAMGIRERILSEARKLTNVPDNITREILYTKLMASLEGKQVTVLPFLREYHSNKEKEVEDV